MAETSQDRGDRVAKWTRLVWLLGFVGVVVAVALLLPDTSGSKQPSITLPDGSTVAFVAMTHLHRPAPGAVRDGTRIRLGHEPPLDEVEGWWTGKYREWWAKAPVWLRTRLPLPKLVFYFHDITFNLGRREPIYRFWLLASSPDFTVGDWKLAINGAECAACSTSAGGAKGPTWLEMDCDYALPTDQEFIRLDFAHQRSGEGWTIEIENPFYRPKE